MAEVWVLTTWTLYTSASGEVVRGVLRELRLHWLVRLVSDTDRSGRLSMVSGSRQYPATELRRVSAVLVERGYVAECSALV